LKLLFVELYGHCFPFTLVIEAKIVVDDERWLPEASSKGDSEGHVEDAPANAAPLENFAGLGLQDYMILTERFVKTYLNFFDQSVDLSLLFLVLALDKCFPPMPVILIFAGLRRNDLVPIPNNQLNINQVAKKPLLFLQNRLLLGVLLSKLGLKLLLEF